MREWANLYIFSLNVYPHLFYIHSLEHLFSFHSFNSNTNIILLFFPFKKGNMFLLREEGEGEKEGEKYKSVSSSTHPNLGPDLQESS